MFTNAINKSNPTGKAVELPRRSSMTIVVGRGKKHHSFERPLDPVGREHMGEVIKAFLFRPELLTAEGVRL